MAAQQITIINESTRLTAIQVTQIAAAVGLYLTDVAKAWNLDAPAVSAQASAPPGAWPIRLVDSDPTPDALGYHEDDSSPSAIVNVGEILDYGGFVICGNGAGSPSVSSVVAHEAAEMLVDPQAVLWSPMPDGRQTCTEVCDWVQDTSYPQSLPDNSRIDVSNFILPAGFLADGKAPFDFLGVLAKPFTMAPGGYMSVRDSTGAVSQVDGQRPPYVLQRKGVGFWANRRAKSWSRAQKVLRQAKAGKAAVR